jgi:hypothetical protein
MTLIGILITLVIVGVLLYLLNTVVPIDPKIKTIIQVVVILAVLLWLAEAFGLIGPYHLTAEHVRLR